MDSHATSLRVTLYTPVPVYYAFWSRNPERTSRCCVGHSRWVSNDAITRSPRDAQAVSKRPLVLRTSFSMDVQFEFDEADNILRLTLSGELTDDSVMDLWSKGQAVVPLFPGCRSIVDASGVTRFNVSTRAVTMLSQKHSPDLPTRVFVTPQDLIYGTTRMFQMLSERTRKNIHVVRTMEEAYKVLGIESPRFKPVPTSG
jgi:hypothetical protein